MTHVFSSSALVAERAASSASLTSANARASVVSRVVSGRAVRASSAVRASARTAARAAGLVCTRVAVLRPSSTAALRSSVIYVPGGKSERGGAGRAMENNPPK